MTSPQRILYVFPATGGIADYAQQIQALYKRLGHHVRALPVYPEDTTIDVVYQVHERYDLIHYEVGTGDGVIFDVSRRFSRVHHVPRIFTIHDPGVAVRNPIQVELTDSSKSAVRFSAKALQKAVNQLVAKPVVNRALNQPKTVKVFLRKDLATGSHTHYLPQPTYHENPPKTRTPKKTLTVGFSGYWGREKGIETLIEAWPHVDAKAKLVLSGAGTDNYADRMKSLASNLKPTPDFPGFIEPEKFDSFLSGLSVLVLPYWPELPAGASAMSMRAAELGVPIIASDTPALRGQLGPKGAVYVPAKDPSALGKAITEVLTKPEVYQKQAAALQQKLFKDHGWDKVQKQLQKIVVDAAGLK